MRFLLATLFLFGVVGVARAAEPVVAIDRQDGSLAIRLGEVTVASYVFRDPQIPRPYFAHVKTPTGKQVTRQHPPREGQDAVDHVGLHTGIWLSFGDLSGCDYWRLKARTEHVRFLEEPTGGAKQASFVVLNRYRTTDGQGSVGEEIARYRIRTVPSGYRIDMSSEFRAGDAELVFGDQEEMGLGIRLATSLAVDRKQGGRILDSAGRRDGAQVWGKTADWCDYSGPFEGKWIGMTVLARQDNFRPCWSHARDYGFLAMNPFGRQAFTKQERSRIVVPKGQSLQLNYGVVVHESDKESDYEPAAAFREFNVVPSADSTGKLECERIPLGESDDYKPCVAQLPQGELLLSAFHQHRQEGEKVLEQNLLFRSSDGGRSWSDPVKLDLLGREPYLSVLKDGTLFLTGHLLANDVRNKWGYTTGFLHRSTDGGRTWQSVRVESESIKPMASNHTSRNVLQLADGSLLLGVDYDGGDGPYFVWRSHDGGQTWDKSQKCQPRDFKSIYGFFGGETWLWQAESGKVWALVRVDSNELPIKSQPIKAENDQADHFILFSSADEGRTFDRVSDFGDYGEMYMSLLRLSGRRLLLTFTVRDLHPPLGVRALVGTETKDGFDFDFTAGRIILDSRTPIGKFQGGGFGPTVQWQDGALVTSYSYRGDDEKTHLEVVRWTLPGK